MRSFACAAAALGLACADAPAVTLPVGAFLSVIFYHILSAMLL